MRMRLLSAQSRRMMMLSPVLLLFCCCLAVSTTADTYHAPPNVPRLTDLFKPVPVSEAFTDYFGGTNVRFMSNGSYANISLNNSTGSGLISNNKYNYGFFSAAIKLPPGLTPGVVVAFYLSNEDSFPGTHDEIDFEFLGHEMGNEWSVQTNIYANGDVTTGREERFHLWFDPTQGYHNYSIIWNALHVVYLVDNVPVREVVQGDAVAGMYPAKPMKVCSTIWDGSTWATQGGKDPVDYKYAPFVASFENMETEGCVVVGNNNTGGGAVGSCSGAGAGGSGSDPIGGDGFGQLSAEQVTGLRWARNRFMTYSYCNDVTRYKVPPPECTAGNYNSSSRT